MFKNVVSYLTDAHHFVNVYTDLPDEIPLNYVRVKYLYCGICGGDYSQFLGYRKKYPISLGHEFVAVVLDYNCNIPLTYDIGDFVVSDFNYRCMKCKYCSSGKSHLCEKNDISQFTNRAFSVYADIHYSYLVKTHIPREYIFRATCVEPLSCIIHAINHYDIAKINTVLLYGVGNIGMLCAFYLSCCLGKKVYIYDSNYKKKEQVMRLFSCEEMQSNISYDLIIEATNSPDGLLECIKNSYYNQEICSFSHLYGQDTSDIYESFVKKESIVYFPLRNGSQNTLKIADNYIRDNWIADYDTLLQIYETNNINIPFEEKATCKKPKQIISFTAGQ